MLIARYNRITSTRAPEMTTCPKSLIRTVFFAALCVLLVPFSSWAAGKGPGETEDPGDAGSKSDATGDDGSKSDATGDAGSEARDQKTEESGEDSSKSGKSKQDGFVAIVRTLEANAEKDGSYLFGGKILADGGATVSGAGVELSLSMNFKKSTELPFTLHAGKSSYRVKTKNLEPGSTCFYRAYVRNLVGRNVGSIHKLKVPALAEKGGWWSEGDKLGAGWRNSKWFGTFRKQAGMDWVYHEKLGWVYAVSDQRGGLWLWQEENGWTWTQPGAWPCLWRNKTGTWLCLMGAIEGKPVFYDYAARKVRNRPAKQEKAKDSDSKANSEKTQPSKEQDRKTEKASKEKAGDKVSGETTDPSKPQENTSDRTAPGASDTDAAKLLARIDKNNLPADYYQGSHHQSYVDRVMAGLQPEQRAWVGELWKEKLRLEPDMPNRGASFVRILTHVVGEAEKSKQPVDSKAKDSVESESSGSNREQTDSKGKESGTKVSDGKVLGETDDRTTQPASSNSKTEDGKATDSKTNTGRASTDSKSGGSSRGETTQSGDKAGDSRADDPAKTDPQKSSR